MIEPENKKLRYFHIILALSFYVDIFVTSLLFANYEYQQGRDHEFFNNHTIYMYIIGLQIINIILSFFKM